MTFHGLVLNFGNCANARSRRSEPGETPEYTVIREVAEETGWRVRPLRMIGFRHFFHLEPRVEGTDRPYPDFIQPIFAAQAVGFDAGRIIPGDHIPCEFMAADKVLRLTEPAQCPLLHAALKMVEIPPPLRQTQGRRNDISNSKFRLLDTELHGNTRTDQEFAIM